jgi:TonB-dependent SusC/RagA subfamily outer membrane receptor
LTQKICIFFLFISKNPCFFIFITLFLSSDKMKTCRKKRNLKKINKQNVKFMRKLTFLLACLLVVSIGLVNAQSKSISGKVISADDGQPIIGATVKVKGSTTGTITNSSGLFKLVVQEGKLITISYIGMKSQEIVPQDGVVVKLVSDSKVMNEIVVTAIGIVREKKTLGYAASSVSGSDLVNSQKTNPMAALQGKVAGVDIMSSPGPGATQSVIIRGASSFGNNQPLYVIDGVPLTNEQNRAGDNMNSQVDFGSGINALNPDDIEEMTVLKGSAASALYGSRAANGVIMIKTKSGKNTNGKVQVAYNGSISTSRVGRLPNEQTLFGQGWSGDRALNENGSWGAAFDGKDRVWGNIVDNSQMIKPYSYLKNRVRDFYDNGLGINNALSLSGGSGRSSRRRCTGRRARRRSSR